MGQVARHLSKQLLNIKPIFNSRMVVEVCESVHLHYRNLRINLSLSDWEQFSKGMIDAYERWKKLGEPKPGKTHIELCRKTVGLFPYDDGIQVSLNHNLYNSNGNKIYSEGAGLHDESYIHVKLRDLRLEMTHDEFIKFSDAIAEARENLT